MHCEAINLLFLYFYNFLIRNEIDINSDWEEIPVLYAILDGGAKDDCNGNGILDQMTIFLVTINILESKIFLGEFPADQMAQESDSIYYSPNDILVWVEEMCNNNTDTISVELIQSDEKPDDGYFSSENHYYFKFSNPLKLYENGESGPKCQ